MSLRRHAHAKIALLTVEVECTPRQAASQAVWRPAGQLIMLAIISMALTKFETWSHVAHARVHGLSINRWVGAWSLVGDIIDARACFIYHVISKRVLLDNPNRTFTACTDVPEQSRKAVTRPFQLCA